MKHSIIIVASICTFLFGLVFFAKCDQTKSDAQYLVDCKVKGDSVEFVENYALADESVIEEYEEMMEERAQNIQNAEENTKIAIEAWQK